MNESEKLELLRDILHGTIDETKQSVHVIQVDPISADETTFIYQLHDDGKITVMDPVGERKTELSLRQVLWQAFNLKRVLKRCHEIYIRWESDNAGGIPYIETKLVPEEDETNAAEIQNRGVKSFTRSFWSGEKRGLSIVLAEYGMGKSSYTQMVRELISKEIKGSFLSGTAAFPFVFDLNEYKSGDFEKFIESELFRMYGLAVSFSCFERLCREGIFCIVLDAWDQMRNARNAFDEVNQNLDAMSRLWKDNGSAIVTCRRTFYQQQLKHKTILAKDAKLFTLCGFNEEAVAEYLEKGNFIPESSGAVNLAGWTKECMKINSELFGKPLNLKLLVNHKNALFEKFSFDVKKVQSCELFQTVFEDWRKTFEVDTRQEKCLKKLVFLTLSAGLNRSIRLESYIDSIGKEKWESIKGKLEHFDFIRIEKETIEFCLAAFQEYMWAYFALVEFSIVAADGKKPRLENDCLVRRYLLVREVREWICKMILLGMLKETNDIFKKCIECSKYGAREEIGYTASNALTLICDLSRIPVYKEQFDNLKKDGFRFLALPGADLRGMDLTAADFYSADLTSADLSYTVLNGVNFKGATVASLVLNEHGMLTKCAIFGENTESLTVAAGTENGGLLTYHIDDADENPIEPAKIIDLQEDIINGLAGDRGGIYTAAEDGWVGYVDDSGNLKNAYLSQTGLQSIASSEDKSVYVGARDMSVYRYSVGGGNREINLNGIELRELEENGGIEDIHYANHSIFFTIGVGTKLLKFRMEGHNQAILDGTAVSNGRFGDICTGGEWLFYHILGEGIYRINVDNFYGEIPDGLLTNDCLLDLKGRDNYIISYAKTAGLIACVKQSGDVRDDYIYIGSSEELIKKVDVDWIFDGTNYAHKINNLKGFAVSEDGRYLAFSGEVLAVFRYNEEDNFYQLYDRPIEAKIPRDEVQIKGCIGMSEEIKAFFDKGAQVILN